MKAYHSFDTLVEPMSSFSLRYKKINLTMFEGIFLKGAIALIVVLAEMKFINNSNPYFD